MSTSSSDPASTCFRLDRRAAHAYNKQAPDPHPNTGEYKKAKVNSLHTWRLLSALTLRALSLAGATLELFGVLRNGAAAQFPTRW